MRLAMLSGVLITLSTNSVTASAGQEPASETAEELGSLALQSSQTRHHVIQVAQIGRRWFWRPRSTGRRRTMKAKGTYTFSAVAIQRLREQVGEVSQIPEDAPQCWSKSTENPARIVNIFHPLHVRDGFVLRAYQFFAKGNGNAVVWALPRSAAFPEPEDCPRVKDSFLSPPKPPLALDDIMGAISGDASATSYLLASILSRELREFGAAWHGLDWATHTVVYRNPITTPVEGVFSRSTTDPTKWELKESLPKQWKPHVQIGANEITVTFYTHSGLGREAIYMNIDTYKPGRYTCETTTKTIAVGPRGFAF